MGMLTSKSKHRANPHTSMTSNPAIMKVYMQDLRNAFEIKRPGS